MVERKSVLITGASRGIGKATAEYFAAHGWYVYAGVRDMRGVRFDHPEIQVVQMDVDSSGSVSRAFHLMKAKLDVVVNNAGIALYGPFESYTERELEQQYSTNVLGVVRVLKAAIPVMNPQGVLINVSSLAGRHGLPNFSAYSSTKFAIEGLSEALYYELSVRQLHVKVVEPALVNTQMVTADVKKAPGYEAFNKKVEAWWEKTFPKADEPEVVAKMIYTAATDGKDQLYYQAPKAKSLIRAKKLWPSNWFAKRYKQHLHR
jgi:NAD(P)-dependent dehydrogenase (short-subunit alcohol dehydrogenase family)